MPGIWSVGGPSQGWLARAEQSDHLTLALDDEAGNTEEGNTIQQLQGHSITYRIARGPHAGRNVLTLQTIPAWEEDDYDYGNVFASLRSFTEYHPTGRKPRVFREAILRVNFA